MRRVLPRAWAIVALAAGLLLPLRLGLAGHPDHWVRTVPLRTHGGLVGSEAPPGQRFLCEGPDLSRIDVALVFLRDEDAGLELVLREGDAGGEVVRRVTVGAGELDGRGTRFVRFAFEPLHESSGRWYHFELRPTGGRPFADHAVSIRYHGRIGRNAPWGSELLESRTVGGTFESPLDELRALAVGCRSLSTARGAVRLELWEPGETEALRTASLPEPTVVESGYVFFGFEPVPDSAGRTYAFRVSSDGEARFVGRDGGVTFLGLHGTPGTRPGLGGATTAGRSLPDRDLVFRAWSRYGWSRGWATAETRAGWRLRAAVLGWAASVLLLAGYLFQAGPGRRGGEAEPR